MERTNPKIKEPFSLKKIIFQWFDIKETTIKGKKWVRVDDQQNIKWV